MLNSQERNELFITVGNIVIQMMLIETIV